MNACIGISPCPNDVFIYAGLILGKVSWPTGEVTFDFQDLETLNRNAQRGQYDAVKISYANFPRCAAQYRLLACGGALGRGCGPLLLTGGEDFQTHREVWVPGEATTAHVLLNAFAASKWPEATLEKRFEVFDAVYRRLRENREAQGVVIHEMRFTYASHGLRLVQDLGAHWEKKTGLPIPLGALVLKRDASITPSAAEAAVRASMDWARTHEAEALALCRKHAQSQEESVMRSHIHLYVNDFSYDLGEEGLAAVQAFFTHLGFSAPD